jgi:hypothetical protein
MAWNVKRSINTVGKEILKFPAGLDAIESIVLAAGEADELSSAVTGVEGKLGLLAGTILTKVPGDSQGRYRQYTGAGGEAVEGILGDNVYFYDDTDASDEPADMLFHGCVFNKDKIIDFDDHDAAVEAALPTCRFDEKEVP